MVTITDQAVAVLYELLRDTAALAGRVVRFIRDQEGGIGILLAEPGAEDVGLRRDAEGPALVMERALADSLAGMVIDCQPTTAGWQTGPELFVHSPQDPR
jgi:hypothetical protein